MSVHGQIKLVRGDGDWFTIEKAEHHNVMTTVMDGPNSGFLYYSGRICDADVEGSAAEMRAIAKAIRKRDLVSFKRCAVDARETLGDGIAYFWSPRNSRTRGVVYIQDADELAEQIERELAALSVSADKEKSGGL